MDEKFLVGLTCGMVGGALIVANSVKARQAVKSGQQKVMDKLDSLGNKKQSKSQSK